MRPGCRRGLALLASMTCAAVVACGGGGDAGPGLSDLLPATPGAGLPAAVVTQEQLDDGEAASALPTDSTATLAELRSVAFRGGYIRIWGGRSNYATMAVLSFGNMSEAAAFREFEHSGIAAGANTYVTAHPGIPGSFVFVITAPTKQSVAADPVFCNGVWFAFGAYAFESLACGATPAWATQVEQVAQAEYRHAESALGSG
jgi:hypothetical protein